MPEYLSADVLLADARLRIEAFQNRLGVLMVEGPDDKRLFYTRAYDPSQIIATGGRTLLLSAYEKASSADLDGMLFLTDCDYAVRRGELSGGMTGLIITVGTTIESDIVSLGTLPAVVMEVVPTAVSSNRLASVCDEIMRLSTLIALPIGRVRMAIQPLGVDVGLGELDISKYWLKSQEKFDEEKLSIVVGRKLRSQGVSVDLDALVAKTPPDDRMCNGKDLLRAMRFILRGKYKVPTDINDTVLCKMLRLAVSDTEFESWDVVARMRRWESETGKALLVRPRRPPDDQT